MGFVICIFLQTNCLYFKTNFVCKYLKTNCLYLNANYEFTGVLTFDSNFNYLIQCLKKFKETLYIQGIEFP